MSVPQDPALPAYPAVSRHWPWVRLLVGVLAVVVGIAAFAWPSATVRVIGFLFGVNLIVTGFVRAVLLPFVPGYPPFYRVLGITLGVLTGVVGIICVRNIAASVTLLLLIIAIGWLLDGLVEIFLAVDGPREAGTGWRIGAGLIMVLGAIAVLTWPKIGLGTFVFIGATILVVVGAGTMISAIRDIRTSGPGARRPGETPFPERAGT
jgi:uncharacterized membrane protein HdeD (DUF308 family)